MALTRGVSIEHQTFDWRARNRRALATRCRDAHVPTPSHLQVLYRRVDAARRGWPPDCRRPAIRVLELLEKHGELTTQQIRKMTGTVLFCEWDGERTQITAWLRKRGYIEPSRIPKHGCWTWRLAIRRGERASGHGTQRSHANGYVRLLGRLARSAENPEEGL